MLEEIGQPVPAAGGFDDRVVRAVELCEVGAQPRAVIRDSLLFDALASIVMRCDHAVAFVLVDAGVVHGALPG